MTEDIPTDETGLLDQAAITIHEMFMAYRRAGFRRREALELVKAQVVTIQGASGQS